MRLSSPNANHPFPRQAPETMTLMPPETQAAAGWNLDHSYAQLPPILFVRRAPMPVRQPGLSILNHAFAETLGLDLGQVPPQTLAEWFTGNQLPPGAQPIAQAYAGHQFGGFTMLGDGRAILLGEQITPTGQRLDVQLKGSGRTEFSRGGDGRAALGPMLREYLISEAMAGLGIPTTRSLAVATTGEPVYRETPLPGAILTRIARSHIRVGTFEFVSARGDRALLETLADYVIERHHQAAAESEHRYLALLHAVRDAQVSLVTQWMAVGFVHGVMNTDNVSIAGETIDYGPCAFLDRYDPDTVFSSIDRDGRYAFGNQPWICQWNLARFAETLLPLLDEDRKKAVDLANAWLAEFPALFQDHWLDAMRRKLGLLDASPDDLTLVRQWLELLQGLQLDYTQSFRRLAESLLEPPRQTTGCSTDPFDSPAMQQWQQSWRNRIAASGHSPQESRQIMLTTNPAVHPRNHRVEQALTEASESGDYRTFQRLLAAVSSPFTAAPETLAWLAPPPDNSPRYRTFCGT